MSTWTKETPTKPGWYWYEDDFYMGPVYLDWVGFRNRPEARELEVDMSADQYGDMVGLRVNELKGQWAKMEEPTK